MEKKQIHLRIPVSADTRKILKRLALDSDMSLADYLRMLIQSALEVAEPNTSVDMSDGIVARRGGAGRPGDDE